MTQAPHRLGLEQHQIAQGGLAGGGMAHHGEVADLFDRAILHSCVSRWRLRINQGWNGLPTDTARAGPRRHPGAAPQGQRPPGWLPI